MINSPSGYVIPREKPDDSSKYSTMAIQNGETLRIEAIYFYNGEYWGIMSINHGNHTGGWVLMDDLLELYGSEDFEKENESSFYTYTGSTDTILTAAKLVIWQWPGSDREKVVIKDEFRMEHFTDIYYTYKDSEGREWGKNTGYWICLSDPENKTDIPSFFPAPKPIKWSYDGNLDWTKEATIWPPAESSEEVIIYSKPSSGSSKLYSAAAQVKSSVSSMATSSISSQVKQGNSTLLVIVIISVSVITVLTIGVLYRVKNKKPRKTTD